MPVQIVNCTNLDYDASFWLCKYFVKKFSYNVTDDAGSGSSQAQSPVFNPQKITFPKHIHCPMDDQFEELAENIFVHCNQVRGYSWFTSILL